MASTPKATGLWPFIDDLGSDDIGPNEIESTSSFIGYDPRWTPASMLGSAIFSGNVLNQESFVDVTSDTSGPFTSHEITIMAWIYPEDIMDLPMALLDFRELPSGSNLLLMLKDGQLSVSIPVGPTEKVTVSSLSKMNQVCTTSARLQFFSN